jgi:hypothetical protein
MQRSQDAFEGFTVTTVIPSGLSAGARQFWSRVIGSVGVQPLFQGPCCQTQSLPTRRHLHGFQIQIPDGLAA